MKPERIWTWERPGRIGSGKLWDDYSQPGSTEYIRADAVAALVSAAVEAERARCIAETETMLRGMLFGQHSSLTIGFNDDHACNYVKAKDWDQYDAGNDDCRIDWVSEDERAMAVENNTVWTLQWYPNTPVGFCCIGASSLSTLIAAAILAGKGE